MFERGCQQGGANLMRARVFVTLKPSASSRLGPASAAAPAAIVAGRESGSSHQHKPRGPCPADSRTAPRHRSAARRTRDRSTACRCGHDAAAGHARPRRWIDAGRRPWVAALDRKLHCVARGGALGYAAVQGVRQGKYFELDIDAGRAFARASTSNSTSMPAGLRTRAGWRRKPPTSCWRTR